MSVHETSWVDRRVASLEHGVIVHPMATIGTVPFSFNRRESPPERKRASGGAYLGRDVEIFAHANVDCGIERTTLLQSGVKVDHHAHIGHDSWIGRDSIICAQAFIGGFVTLGARCYVGAGARIKPRVTLGNDVTVGMGAVVLEDVPAGATVVGNPSRVLK